MFIIAFDSPSEFVQSKGIGMILSRKNEIVIDK
jgi:hypothetical protein